MVQKYDIQKLLFDLVKEQLPPHISLPDVVSDLLQISYDSVYRRLRGQKPLTLLEIQKISTHFNISVDALFNLKTDTVVFQQATSSRQEGIKSYLAGINQDLELVKNTRQKKIIVSAKDIPLLHYFNFPELAWFKLFFWGKTILKQSGSEKQLFSCQKLDPEIIRMGKNALKIYSQIPSAEIWSMDTPYSTIRQIDFYLESGFFADTAESDILNNQLYELIEHFKNEAEYGQKFMYGEKPIPHKENFELYINEIILGNNTILIETELQTKAYFLHDVLDFLHTSDKQFCETTAEILDNIIKKSSLISLVNEKERNKFFINIFKKLGLHTTETKDL